MVQGFIAGGPAALTRAQEGAEDRPESGAADPAAAAQSAPLTSKSIGIAASGSTPSMSGALSRVCPRSRRTHCFIVASTPIPDLDLKVDVAILPIVGPEVITGSDPHEGRHGDEARPEHDHDGVR